MSHRGKQRTPSEDDSDGSSAELNANRLLAAYDEQLRTEAETPSAIEARRLGPLLLVTFGGGRGFCACLGQVCCVQFELDPGLDAAGESGHAAMGGWSAVFMKGDCSEGLPIGLERNG